jgi:membrane associated rhomboid family serine protease
MIRNWRVTVGRASGALRGPAPVTYGLIALCCLVFVIGPASGLDPAYGSGEAALAAQRAYFHRWGVVPAELFEGSPGAALTPATALFVHGSWVHLLGNMLFLYVFGVMTEERMGRAQFLLFYVGCGYLALLGYAAANADSEQSLVGASGAISAVLGALLFLFPGARVTSLLPFLFFWAALQWLAAGRAPDGPGVAYLAHLVGFGLGLVFAWVRFGRATRVRAAPAPAPEGENPP